MVVYADFESILRPIHGPPTAAQADATVSSTRPYQKHEAMSVGVYVVSGGLLPHFERPYEYTGENAAHELMMYLERLAVEVQALYERIEPMIPLSRQEQEAHDAATECFICEKPFRRDNVKVRDHCHISGNYRGAAHSKCNINYKNPSFIPIFFHNLSG